jgi:hypothetical protein
VPDESYMMVAYISKSFGKVLHSSLSGYICEHDIYNGRKKFNRIEDLPILQSWMRSLYSISAAFGVNGTFDNAKSSLLSSLSVLLPSGFTFHAMGLIPYPRGPLRDISCPIMRHYDPVDTESIQIHTFLAAYVILLHRLSIKGGPRRLCVNLTTSADFFTSYRESKESKENKDDRLYTLARDINFRPLSLYIKNPMAWAHGGTSTSALFVNSVFYNITGLRELVFMNNFPCAEAFITNNLSTLRSLELRADSDEYFDTARITRLIQSAPALRILKLVTCSSYMAPTFDGVVSSVQYLAIWSQYHKHAWEGIGRSFPNVKHLSWRQPYQRRLETSIFPFDVWKEFPNLKRLDIELTGYDIHSEVAHGVPLSGAIPPGVETIFIIDTLSKPDSFIVHHTVSTQWAKATVSTQYETATTDIPKQPCIIEEWNRKVLGFHYND